MTPQPIPVLVNPSAGTAAAVTKALEADDRFRARPTPPASLAEVLAEALRSGAGAVVVAGGDGTVATAAGVLSGSATVLGVVPAGTLNHFAVDHGLPLQPAEALEVALHGAPARVDLASVNGRTFLNTSAVGAYVPFVRLRERWEPRLGYHLASLAAVVVAFFRLRSFVVELTADGEVRRYRTPLVFVGVGERELRPPKLGGRKPDGERGLHLLIVPETPRLRLLAMAVRTLVRGVRPWAGEAEVDSLIVDRCTVSMTRGSTLVALDGELVPFTGALEYVHHRDALSIRLPATPDDR